MDWREARARVDRAIHEYADLRATCGYVVSEADAYALALAREVAERTTALLGENDPQYAGELRADMERLLTALEAEVRGQ